MKLKNYHCCCTLALLVLVLLTSAVFPSSIATAGNDIQSFLDAPVWYVDFEVSFKASLDTTYAGASGKFHTTISLNRTFSAVWPLDLRSQGPSPVLGASFASGTADGSAPSVEEQMKFAQDLMARMGTAANWMSSGGALSVAEDATYEESQAAAAAGMDAAKGPASLDYLRVDIGKGLLNEMGDPYDLTNRTTRKGSGMVWPGGGQSITFEIDAASKKYALVLPLAFHDMLSKMTVEEFSRLEMAGQAPTETSDTQELGLAFFPHDLTLDDPKNLQAGMAMIRGDIDPSSGKITGERSFAAHYSDHPQITVRGNLLFRYTLTTTPSSKSQTSTKP